MILLRTTQKEHTTCRLVCRFRVEVREGASKNYLGSFESPPFHNIAIADIEIKRTLSLVVLQPQTPPKIRNAVYAAVLSES